MALKTSLVIDLAGNMQTRARQYGQSLTTMGKAGQAAMRGLKSSAAAAGRGLDTLGNRYTAVITGAGLLFHSGAPFTEKTAPANDTTPA